MTRRQCKLCPWKVSTDPLDIPGGYEVALHEHLRRTIADRARFEDLLSDKPLRIMACHESNPDRPIPCVGWLVNQLERNNLPLRFAMIKGRIDCDVELVGPQHENFEDTLPKRRT